MSIFGSIGSVFPDNREKSAGDELRAAERAFEVAEDRLIKARRAYEEASREWLNFYDPQQEQY